MAYTCSCANDAAPSNSNPYASGQRVTSANSGSTWTADTTVGGRDLELRHVHQPRLRLERHVRLVAEGREPGRRARRRRGRRSVTRRRRRRAPRSSSRSRRSNSATGPFNFVGPDGTAATFFTTSGASLSQFNGFRYLKYKAFLSTTNGAVTPSLSSVAGLLRRRRADEPDDASRSPRQPAPSAARPSSRRR